MDLVFRQVGNDVGKEQERKKFSQKEETLGVGVGQHQQTIQEGESRLTMTWDPRLLNHQQWLDAIRS